MSREKEETRASFKKNAFDIEEFIKIDDEKKQIKKDKNGNFIYKDNFGNVKLAIANSKPNIEYQNKYLLNTEIENGELKANITLNKNKLENTSSSKERLLKVSEKINQYDYNSINDDNIEKSNKIICLNCKTLLNDSDQFCFNCGSIFINEIVCFNCKTKIKNYQIDSINDIYISCPICKYKLRDWKNNNV